MDLAEKLCDSRIKQIQLLSKYEVLEIKKILNLDMDFEFDMIILLDQ
jgi:hypothetical protein